MISVSKKGDTKVVDLHLCSVIVKKEAGNIMIFFLFLRQRNKIMHKT